MLVLHGLLIHNLEPDQNLSSTSVLCLKFPLTMRFLILFIGFGVPHANKIVILLLACTYTYLPKVFDVGKKGQKVYPIHPFTLPLFDLLKSTSFFHGLNKIQTLYLIILRVNSCQLSYIFLLFQTSYYLLSFLTS